MSVAEAVPPAAVEVESASASEVPPRASAAAEFLPGVAVRRWAAPARTMIMVACDAVALASAALVASRLGGGWGAMTGPVWLAGAGLLSAVFVLGYAAAGLYPGFGIGAVETLRLLTRRTTLAFMALAAASLLLPARPTSPLPLVIAWLACITTVPTMRYIVLSRASRWLWWGEPAVVIGSPDRVTRIVRLLSSAATVGYRPSAIVTADAGRLGRSCAGLPVLAGVEEATALAARGVSTAIVLDGREDHYLGYGAMLQAAFRHVIVVPDPAGLPVEGVGTRNLGGLLGIEFRNESKRWVVRLVKRTTDVVLGTVCLVIVAPVIAASALAIKIASRGPAFFSQVREGLAGRRVKVWKLRTMWGDAEHRLHDVLNGDPEAARSWETRFKIRDDPRIVPVIGPLLRSWSIDELPQLWNVVKGEMSLVGPRPFPDYHLEKFTPEARELRRRVRPGITGLWQVMVRGEGSVDEQQLFDSYYIRNWSVWMDIYLLAKTVFVVLSRRGAY